MKHMTGNCSPTTTACQMGATSRPPCRSKIALFNPKTSISIQKITLYIGYLNSKTSEDSKNVFLHCADVLALRRITWHKSFMLLPGEAWLQHAGQGCTGVRQMWDEEHVHGRRQGLAHNAFASTHMPKARTLGPTTCTAITIVLIQTLSSSWWARYVQDKSCLSI